MKKNRQAKSSQLRLPAKNNTYSSGNRAGHPAGLGHSWLRYCWVLAYACGMGLLTVGCSEDKLARHDSELSTTPQSEAAPAESPTATDIAPNEEAGPSGAAGGGRRYRVIAGTSYFYTSPEQTKPTGRYLLRNDVLYGEERRNGFVKTRFKTPNGATVVGWLKQEELGQLAAEATAGTARRPPAPSPPAAHAKADEYNYEADPEPAKTAPTPATASAGSSAATGARRAVVQAPRSYFYNSPDLSVPRKAHCVQGDKVQLGEVSGDAVYVTFTNWEKVTTRGWMRKDALRPLD